MPSVNKNSLIPYSAKQMYDLVHNYERYPEFVPGCILGSTISREKELIARISDQSKQGFVSVYH